MTAKKPRIIKKYPNRRLYDTTDSKYVTLARIRELLLEDEQIQVYDSVSEEDITRQILMQIITEQENSDSPLLSTELLTKLIQLYEGVVPGAFHEYMEKSLDVFLKQQSVYQDQVRNVMGTDDPMKAFTELAEQNLRSWERMQESMLKMYGLDRGGKEGSDDPGKKRG